MVDFEEATRAAVEKLTAFIERADLAHEGVEESLGASVQALTRVETDLTDFSSATVNCSETVSKGNEGQLALVGEVEHELDAMITSLETLQEEINTQVEATKESLSNLGAEIETLGEEIDTSVDQMQQALGTLLARIETTEDRLDSATSEVMGQLEELSKEVSAHQSAVEERGVQLQAYFVEECAPSISEKGSHLVEKADHLAQSVKEKLNTVQEHLEGEAVSTVDQAISDQMAELQRLVRIAEDVERLLELMSDALRTIGQTAVTTHKTMDDAVVTTNVGLESVLQFCAELDELRGRLQDHGVL